MRPSPAPPSADGLTLELPAGRPQRMQRVQAQLEHLFGSCPFPVHLGLGCPPAGYRVIDSWRVIPRATNPRFLAPLAARSARASLTSHNGLRTPTTAAIRTMAGLSIGAMIGSGCTRVVQLTVPASVSDQQLTEHLLTYQLRQVVPGAHATAISLRDFHPRAKPTLQLLDVAGHIIGFAKAARDGATAQRVVREADLLSVVATAVATQSQARIRVPQVIRTGRVGAFAYSVVTPLPASARRVRRSDEPEISQLSKQFCQAVPQPNMPLSHTALWQDTYRSIAQLPTHFDDPELTDLAAALRDLARITAHNHAHTTVSAGFFHGDWVPWNMGWVGAGQDRQLWVWDLEYGSTSGPLGLDALRWEFQIRHVQDRRTFGDAIAAMATAAPHMLARIGVDPQVGPALIRLHLLENIATALALAAGGRGLPFGLAGAGQVLRRYATSAR